MKIRTSLFAWGFALAGCTLAACEDDTISIDSAKKDPYAVDQTLYASLVSETVTGDSRQIEIRQESLSEKLYFKLNREADRAIDLHVKIDPAALETYNKQHGTDFEILPTTAATLENEGAIVVAPHEVASQPFSILLKKEAALEQGKTYALPLTAESKTDGCKITAAHTSFLLLIKAMGQIPDAGKPSGIRTMFLIEVNRTNPLNVGEYTLKQSGKPFADVVNIFAANINYNATTGRVYISLNENVKHILDNREKYLKPLQDKGIKIHLTILGNGDPSGVSRLGDETARDFARQLKALVDLYRLDGILFDDEYTDHTPSKQLPGLVVGSNEAYARLCYETKRLMPDKECGIYHYTDNLPLREKLGFNFKLDGLQPSDFVDFVLEPMYKTFNATIYSKYLGLTAKKYSPYSRKISTGLTVGRDIESQYTSTSLRRVVSGGYGLQVFYDLNLRDNDKFIDYQRGFNAFATAFYSDEIVFSGEHLEKDW